MQKENTWGTSRSTSIRDCWKRFFKKRIQLCPNTAESAYYGFMEQLRLVRRAEVKQKLLDANKSGELSDSLIDDLVMDNWPKGEKIANKDIKLRTFISQESGRAQLVSHVYDITYGVIRCWRCDGLH